MFTHTPRSFAPVQDTPLPSNPPVSRFKSKPGLAEAPSTAACKSTKVGQIQNKLNGLPGTKNVASILGTTEYTIRRHIQGQVFYWIFPGEIFTMRAHSRTLGSCTIFYFDPVDLDVLKAKVRHKKATEPIETVAKIVGLSVRRVTELLQQNGSVFSYTPLEGNKINLPATKTLHGHSYLFVTEDVDALRKAVKAEKDRCMTIAESADYLSSLGTPITLSRLNGFFDCEVRVFDIDCKHYAIYLKRDPNCLYAGKPTKYLYRQEVEAIHLFLKYLETLTAIAVAEKRFGLKNGTLRERARQGTLDTICNLGEHWLDRKELTKLEVEFSRKAIPEGAVRLPVAYASLPSSARAIAEHGVGRDPVSYGLFITAENEYGVPFKVRVYEDIHKGYWLAREDLDNLIAIDSKFGSGREYATTLYFKGLFARTGFGTAFVLDGNGVPNLKLGIKPIPLQVVMRGGTAWLKASEIFDHLIGSDPEFASALASKKKGNSYVLSRNYGIYLPVPPARLNGFVGAPSPTSITADSVELLLFYRRLMGPRHDSVATLPIHPVSTSAEEIAFDAIKDLVLYLYEKNSLTELEQVKLWLARNYFVVHSFSSREIFIAMDQLLNTLQLNSLFSIPIPSNSRFFDGLIHKPTTNSGLPSDWQLLINLMDPKKGQCKNSIL